MPNYSIRNKNKDDRDWVRQLLTERSGSDVIVSRGIIYRPQNLPGFVAVRGQERLGLITYHINADSCEIVSLDSLEPSVGIGTALIEAVQQAARKSGCQRLWLITTNDNANAIRFYQKRNFTLSAIYRNAIEESRKLKPEIPLIGNDGIPIRDEIELEIGIKT